MSIRNGRKRMSDYVTIYKFNHKTKEREFGMQVSKKWLPALGINLESDFNDITFGEEAYRMFEKKVRIAKNICPGESVAR